MKTAYINAHTIDHKQAFIVEDGRFTHVGSKRKILSQSIDTIIDLKDQTVLPGFNDAHLHVLGLGKMMNMVDVSEAPSIDAMIETLKASNHNPIIGRGYKETQFSELREPTKEDLDEVSKDVPVLLYRFCSHVMIANSKAIEMALKQNGAYPENQAHYDIEKGRFSESARAFLMALEPEDDAALRSMILKGQAHLLKHGITSVGSDDFGVVSVHYETVLNVFKGLAQEGLLKLRVLEQVNIPDAQAFDDFLDKGYPHKAYGRYRIGPVKLLSDGSLGGRTAALRMPYKDDASTSGFMVFDKVTLQKRIEKARVHHMDYAMHAIGDKAIETLIEISEALGSKHFRDAIIHAQLADETQIKRMQKLNLGAQIQPAFTASDAPIVYERLGERASHAYLFNTMLKENIPVAFSTDAPIENVNPFHTLYNALKRTPIHDEYPPHIPEESIPLKVGLEAYSKMGAYFARMDGELGHIKKGELADFVVVEKFDFKNPDTLKTAQINETYIEGEQVFKKEVDA